MSLIDTEMTDETLGVLLNVAGVGGEGSDTKAFTQSGTAVKTATRVQYIFSKHKPLVFANIR